MNMYLDYSRLTEENVRASVYDFLVRVYGNDEEREAISNFPKFFSPQPSTDIVHRSALAKRAAEVERYDENSEYKGEFLTTICKWFSIELLQYAGTDRIDRQRGTSLPADFKLERDESYDGLVDDPWIINVPDKDGKMTDVLVLSLQLVQDDDRNFMGGICFFLIGIPTDRVSLEKAPIDQTDEERFD